jgi:hypothetical protein
MICEIEHGENFEVVGKIILKCISSKEMLECRQHNFKFSGFSALFL